MRSLLLEFYYVEHQSSIRSTWKAFNSKYILWKHLQYNTFYNVHFTPRQPTNLLYSGLYMVCTLTQNDVDDA